MADTAKMAINGAKDRLTLALSGALSAIVSALDQDVENIVKLISSTESRDALGLKQRTYRCDGLTGDRHTLDGCILDVIRQVAFDGALKKMHEMDAIRLVSELDQED